MDYLLTKDYHSIIEFAISLKEEEIHHYFFNQYLKLNPSNPDFVDKLSNTIKTLDDRFKILIERETQSKKAKKSNTKTKNQNLLKINRDWNNHSFFYLDGILNFDFLPTWLNKKYKIFTLNKFYEIQKGFNKFKLNVKTKKQVNDTPLLQNIKLKWKGTPAQFCYIIDLLINKGYLEQPTAKGERSAKLLLEHFEFENDNPSFGSLGRNLHKNFDPIKNIEHRKLFQKIPHRNDLDK